MHDRLTALMEPHVALAREAPKEAREAKEACDGAFCLPARDSSGVEAPCMESERATSTERIQQVSMFRAFISMEVTTYFVPPRLRLVFNFKHSEKVMSGISSMPASTSKIVHFSRLTESNPHTLESVSMAFSTPPSAGWTCSTLGAEDGGLDSAKAFNILNLIVETCLISATGPPKNCFVSRLCAVCHRSAPSTGLVPL